jgi:hypothetical protein
MEVLRLRCSHPEAPAEALNESGQKEISIMDDQLERVAPKSNVELVVGGRPRALCVSAPHCLIILVGRQFDSKVGFVL